MSYFHKEGARYITLGLALSFGAFIAFVFLQSIWILLLFFLFLLFLIFSLQFFRYPSRQRPSNSGYEIIAPADGKLVANEILDDGRRQLSIFMSPLNVHANWVPISGKVTRSEYIPGKYLVAWHPKSSTENERHEIDIHKDGNIDITVKQIAGAVARRIVCYLKAGEDVKLGDELGFIKFGSRVDILLPASAQVLVNIDEKVTGNVTQIAKLSNNKKTS